MGAMGLLRTVEQSRFPQPSSISANFCHGPAGPRNGQKRSSLSIRRMGCDGARAVPCGRMQCLVLVRQDVGVPVAHLAPELQKNRANPFRARSLKG